MSKTIAEMREELNNWHLMLDSKNDLFSELENRIISVRKEIKKEKNKNKKEDLKGTLAEYENLNQQLTENVYFAPSQIAHLEQEIRKAIKAEQIQNYKKHLG